MRIIRHPLHPDQIPEIVLPPLYLPKVPQLRQGGHLRLKGRHLLREVRHRADLHLHRELPKPTTKTMMILLAATLKKNPKRTADSRISPTLTVSRYDFLWVSFFLVTLSSAFSYALTISRLFSSSNNGIWVMILPL